MSFFFANRQRPIFFIVVSLTTQAAATVATHCSTGVDGPPHPLESIKLTHL